MQVFGKVSCRSINWGFALIFEEYVTFWNNLTFIRCNGNPVKEHLLTDTYDACLNQCKSHPIESSMEGSTCSWITYDEKTKFCQLFEECDPPNLNTKLIQEDWHHLASERDCPAVPDCYFRGKCQVWSLKYVVNIFSNFFL